MNRFLYLHGFASSPRSQKAQYLEQRFAERQIQLEIPDLAEQDFEHLTISSQLAVIEQTARGESVCLIGSSMGGYLAALYAARHPEIRKLVLLAPAFQFAKGWEQMFGPERMKLWRETGSTLVYHFGAGEQKNLSYELWQDSHCFEEYPAFTQPALLFHGLHDEVVPPEVSERFAANHPNAVLRLMESDHQLTNVLDEIWREASVFLIGSAHR